MIPLTLTADLHEEALSRASHFGDGKKYSIGVLNTVVDTEEDTWIRRIWDFAEGAIRSAVQSGMDAARPIIEQTGEKIAEMTSALGERATVVKNAVMEKISTYIKSLIDLAVARLDLEIKIGARQYLMKKISVQQKFSVSGTVTSSLKEACAFAANGEVTVDGEYELQV